MTCFMELPHDILREARRGHQANYQVVESNDFEQFWSTLLIPRLRERYNAVPVHTTDEIRYLKDKFPDKIRLFCIEEGEMIAGTVMYETPLVAHSQYTSSSQKGRESGALNLLTTTLINQTYLEKPYFDFGTAHDDSDFGINFGLLDWKERMGARMVSHDFYSIDTERGCEVLKSLTL